MKSLQQPGFVFLLLAVAACSLQSARDRSNAEERGDSAAYVTALEKWLRDSIVLDSLSRLVNTDSLYRLHRAMVKSSDPQSVAQEIACEEYRLVWRYGPNVALRAARRLDDSLWSGVPAESLAAMERRFTRPTFIHSGHARCGDGGYPLAAEQFDGTSLSDEGPRPVRR